MARRNRSNDDDDDDGQPSGGAPGWQLSDILPSFGFGSIIFLAIIGIGIYFLGWTERGRELLNQAIGRLPESWQSTIAGWMLPAEINQAVNPDAATFTRFRNIVTQAGGNLMDSDSLYTPEVLSALMLEAPDIVQNLIAAQPAEGANMTEAQRATAGKIRTAVRGIAGNSQMMATLFDSQHRASTLSILDAMGRRSLPFLPEGRLAQFIERVGFHEGQPTPKLIELLNAMLLEDPTARQTAVAQLIGRVDPAARRELLAGVDPSQIQDRGMRAGVSFAQHATPRELQAALAVQADLQRRHIDFDRVMSAMATPQGQAAFLLNPVNRELLAPHLGRIAIVAQERAGNSHYPAAERQLYAFLGTTGIRNGQPDQAVNMAATMSFFREVGSNSHNTGDGATRARHVITGMMSLIAGDREAAGRLNAGEVAAFFENQQNVDAFGNLLHRLNLSRLPSRARPVVETLRDYWDRRADGQNISEVMGHQPSVALLIQGIRESLANPNAPSTIISDLAGPTRWWVRWMPSGVPSEAAENIYAMQAIQDALIGAGVVHRPVEPLGLRDGVTTPQMQRQLDRSRYGPRD